VIADYRSAYPDPIVLCVGDEVTIEDRESEWTGWIWCATLKGKSGWVPESYIQRGGSSGTALRNYDATELSVTKGEQLTILEEVSSWYWCQTENGCLGWVPKQNVEAVPKTR
jgi:uncharacterized protein YgiM (DUF1202 family)